MTSFLCLILGGAALIFGIKLFIIKQSIGEISRQIDDILSGDTNSLIFVNSNDRDLNSLAADLNRELSRLRSQRLKYLNGDRELKDAVTNISHDLRTPLTAICGYLELLKREEKSPTVERYLGYIENRTEAMKKLTEELFRYSVIISTSEDMSLEPIDLSGALEQSVAEFYGSLTAKGIEPVITLPESKIVKNLNREALSRIFGNIIGNAIKYSSGDFEINMEESGAVSFTNSAPNLGGVDVGKLFDRFFSVEAARNSTGLGLAISKTLVGHMGGQISASYDNERLTIRIDWNTVPDDQ